MRTNKSLLPMLPDPSRQPLCDSCCHGRAGLQRLDLFRPVDPDDITILATGEDLADLGDAG
jgi:hypothetical protein